MFSTVSRFTFLALALAGASQVAAHAAVSPALGVTGTPARRDVERPSNNNPCGGVNVASALAAATPVQAAADGTFTVTAINFNGGRDGSRQFTAQVDPSGAGTNFGAGVTISTNGDPAPQGTGTEPIVASLGNTACTGGAAGNTCLVQFRSSAGFGNCVAVQSATAGAAAGGAAAGNAAGNAGAAAGNAGAAAGNAGAAAGNAGAATTPATTATTGTGRTRGGRRGRAAAAAAAARLRARTPKTESEIARALTLRAARAMKREIRAIEVV